MYYYAYIIIYILLSEIIYYQRYIFIYLALFSIIYLDIYLANNAGINFI